MRKTVITAIALTLTAAVAFAEEPKKEARKPLSPPATAEARISGKTLTIKYSAPAKRGRIIMGGLVPYGKVWRTGANAATTLTTETDVMIGSIHVPAGTYTLYTIPAEKEWTLIVNKQTGQWGTIYDQTQDLGRTKLTVKRLEDTAEAFAIAIKPTTANRGVLSLTWENTEASVPIVVH